MENQYRRSVREDGNRRARELLFEVYEVCDRKWRGLGEVAASGLQLSAGYREFDAELRFGLEDISVAEPKECISAMIFAGVGEAEAVLGVWDEMHAGVAAGGSDGVVGGCLRGILLVSATQRRSE